MADIEIVDSLFKPVQNPHEDRITAILQKRAQPAPQMISPGEFDAYGIGNVASRTGPQQFLDAINKLQSQREDSFYQSQDRELQSAQGLYDLFENKRASGDKQAQALFDRISLFTGGDPEGTALFVQELHNDPESIDPSNAFQVMTKLAGIAKKTGYTSLDSQLKRAQIRSANALASQRAAGPSGKPMPAAALKLQNEGLDIIGTVNSINSRLETTKEQLKNKELTLGPIANKVSAGMNYMGYSTENTRNYDSFIRNLEKLRNDSLRLNKGVQTEGDATRAWNEIIANPNDEKLVEERLDEIIGYNERAAELQKLNVDQIRANYGNDPIDYSQFESPVTPAEDDSDLLDYMTPEERALFK